MKQRECVEDVGPELILEWGQADDAVGTPQVPEPRRLLRVEEAAHQLGIERTLMYELVGSGAVESVRIGRLRRIPVACLDEFVANLRAAAHGSVAS